MLTLSESPSGLPAAASAGPLGLAPALTPKTAGPWEKGALGSHHTRREPRLIKHIELLS